MVKQGTFFRASTEEDNSGVLAGFKFIAVLTLIVSACMLSSIMCPHSYEKGMSILHSAISWALPDNKPVSNLLPETQVPIFQR